MAKIKIILVVILLMTSIFQTWDNLCSYLNYPYKVNCKLTNVVATWMRVGFNWRMYAPDIYKVSAQVYVVDTEGREVESKEDLLIFIKKRLNSSAPFPYMKSQFNVKLLTDYGKKLIPSVKTYYSKLYNKDITLRAVYFYPICYKDRFIIRYYVSNI